MKQIKIEIKRISIILLFVFSFSHSAMQAQQVIPASGGNATGSGGTVSYTIGQVVYTTNSNTNGSVAKGVQQAFEISEVIGIKEAKKNNFEISVYPNPTNDFITLKVENHKVPIFFFQLYDMNGKLLRRKKLTDKEIIISTANLVPETYLLKVINNKMVKTFKIMKNHKS